MYKNRGNSHTKSSNLRYFFFFLSLISSKNRRENVFDESPCSFKNAKERNIDGTTTWKRSNPNWKIRGEISAWLKFRGFQAFRYNSSREMLGLVARRRLIARQKWWKGLNFARSSTLESVEARSKFFSHYASCAALYDFINFYQTQRDVNVKFGTKARTVYGKESWLVTMEGGKFSAIWILKERLVRGCKIFYPVLLAARDITVEKKSRRIMIK